MTTVFVLWLFVHSVGAVQIDTFATREACTDTGNAALAELGKANFTAVMMCISKDVRK